MSNEKMINDLVTVTMSRNHKTQTEFLIKSKNEILEMDLSTELLDNFLKLSLYKFFSNADSWENLIKEAEKHNNLIQMVSNNLNNPSDNIYHALIDGFYICYNKNLPNDFKRLMVLCSDDYILCTLSVWATLSSSDLYELKQNNLLKSDDFKKMVEIIKKAETPDKYQIFENCNIPQFTGILSGWDLSVVPEYFEKTFVLTSLYSYQGMGWVCRLGHIVNSDSGKNLFVRMDGGSSGLDVDRNQQYFSTTLTDDFTKINWEEFQSISEEIVTNTPAFEHPMMVSYR